MVGIDPDWSRPDKPRKFNLKVYPSGEATRPLPGKYPVLFEDGKLWVVLDDRKWPAYRNKGVKAGSVSLENPAVAEELVRYFQSKQRGEKPKES